jgi:hypothetical protein
MLKIEDLKLRMIDDHARLVIGDKLVAAIAYAARRGWGNVSCRRFVTALVMMDALKDSGQWPAVLKKIDELKAAEEIFALRNDRVVTGEIE